MTRRLLAALSLAACTAPQTTAPPSPSSQPPALGATPSASAPQAPAPAAPPASSTPPPAPPSAPSAMRLPPPGPRPPRSIKIGPLVVSDVGYDAPSHGLLLQDPRLRVENKGGRPVTVHVDRATLVSEQGVVELAVWGHSLDDRALVETSTFVMPPGGTVGLRLHTRVSPPEQPLYYHTAYHHEITLSAKGEQGSVSAGMMYFRYPHGAR